MQNFPDSFSADPNVQKLSQILSGQSVAAPSKSREDRVAEARDEIEQNNPNAKALQSSAAAAVRKGLSLYGQRSMILGNQDLTDEARARQFNEFDANYDAQLLAFAESASSSINKVASLILPAEPDFAPSSAVDAANIASISADADSYDPPTFFRVARNAKMKGNLPLVKRLHDKLSGFAGWKVAYKNDPKTGGVIDELADALATPDVIRSEAAQDWVKDASNDLRYLISQLRSAHGKIDPSQITVGAMPMLFPDNVYPVATGPSLNGF